MPSLIDSCAPVPDPTPHINNRHLQHFAENSGRLHDDDHDDDDDDDDDDDEHKQPSHELVGSESTTHTEPSPVPIEGVFPPNAGHDDGRSSSSESDANGSEGSVDDGSAAGASADGGEAEFPNELHFGLATYDSQRASSAAGVGGTGGGVGEDEYSRMLKQMQQVRF